MTEGDVAATLANVVVQLSASSGQAGTVNYATADGTAVAGTNYTATSGTLAFAPGVTSETIRLPTLDSGSQTAALTFTLTLSNPEAATLARRQAVGTTAPSDADPQSYAVTRAALSPHVATRPPSASQEPAPPPWHVRLSRARRVSL